MDAKMESEPTPTKSTAVERKSERELVVTRTVNAPSRLVLEAVTKANTLRAGGGPEARGGGARQTGQAPAVTGSSPPCRTTKLTGCGGR